MILTVSVSELRSNISQYLDRVMQGTRVLIRDEKRGKDIAQITQAFSFNKSDYERVLRKAVGIFSEENHPEWASKSQVIDWVNKSRLSDDRSF